MFQLNLSSSVHRVTQLYPECVLELLKLSSTENECKPLPWTAHMPRTLRTRLQPSCEHCSPPPWLTQLVPPPAAPALQSSACHQGLTLAHFSAQRKSCLWDRGCI
jgi:hypothetical protein